MDHDCCRNSCSHEHSHHHSESSCKGECCGSHHCHCSCHNKQGKYADDLLKLADDAWMEILKDKIKEEIRLNAGEHLTQLAKLVATANHARWKNKMQDKKDYEDFECQLKSMTSGSQKK